MTKYGCTTNLGLGASDLDYLTVDPAESSDDAIIVNFVDTAGVGFICLSLTDALAFAEEIKLNAGAMLNG